jgi:hypothetical protein
MKWRNIRLESEVIKIEEPQEYVLNGRSRRNLDTLMGHLSNFQRITKNLQKRGMSPDMVRSVFDLVVEDYPEMREYLYHRANIVNNPDFKSGLVKILHNFFLNLTDIERRATFALMKAQ